MKLQDLERKNMDVCDSRAKEENDVSTSTPRASPIPTPKLSRIEMDEPDIGSPAHGASTPAGVSKTCSDADKSDVDSEPSLASILSDMKKDKFNRRWAARRVVLSAKFQIFMLVVLVLDLCALILEVWFIWTLDEVSAGLAIAILLSDWLTLSVYSSEVALGLYGFGLRNYCRSPWNIVDLVVLSAASILTLLDSGPTETVVMTRALKFGKHAKFLKIAGRALRCVHIAQLTRQRKLAMRTIVSKNKFRYLDLRNNIDLDLTYITSDLIAMGAPVSGCIESMYRNPQKDVVRFFRNKHDGHFRIYNLCPELKYADEPFTRIGGSVKRFDIEDHTPPKMDQFIDFLEDAREFRASAAKNTLAIHCKAGKGRTGSFCCAWLVYFRKCKTADQALDLFARRRTDQRISGRLRGVETPSQVRYVKQLCLHLERTSSWFTSPLAPPPVPIRLVRLTKLELSESFLAKPAKLKYLRVLVQSVDAVTGVECCEETRALRPDGLGSIDLYNIPVMADVTVSLFEEHGRRMRRSNSTGQARARPPTEGKVPSATRRKDPFKEKGLFVFFTFHTGFLEMFEKEAGVAQILAEELDKGPKRIKQGAIGEGSYVRLHFSDESSVVYFPKETDDAVV